MDCTAHSAQCTYVFNDSTRVSELPDILNSCLIWEVVYLKSVDNHNSQKQLPSKLKLRLVIIECAGYIIWQLFL